MAVIEYHLSDEYANTYSNARASYYGIGGIPDCYFDGLTNVVGGSTGTYAQYLSRYNQRISVPSSFSIDVAGLTYGLETFEANVTVNKVAASSASNFKLHLALTESEVGNGYNYVERLMAPSASGTTIDFSSGNTQEVTLNFSLDDDWVYENCEVVVFLQSNSNKEVHQTVKMPLSDFLPAYSYDASVNAVNNVPVSNCSESVAPIVTIRNNGSETLTSLDLNYSVNGGTVSTHNWTGSLEFLETADVELPAIDFTLDENNTAEVNSANPNGQPDQYTSNDAMTESFDEAQHTPTTVKLMLRLDSHPEETSWEVVNDEGEVVYSGGNYTQGGQNITEEFDLYDDPGCYTFSIFDSEGNGLGLPGFYMLYYGSNTVIIQGTDFGAQESIQFIADDFVAIEDQQAGVEFSVYPNPFKTSATLSFSIAERTLVEFEIYNMVGQSVYASSGKVFEAGIHNEIISPENLEAGIYFIQITAGEKTYTEKISISR